MLPIVFLLCTACPEEEEPADYFLVLANNSAIPIVYYFDYTHYKENDTIFWYGEDLFRDMGRNTIQPAEKKELEMYNDNLKYHFKLGSINYYFFDREVVDSLNWQEISEKYLVLKRVTVNSIEQLDSMNWEITYP